MAFPNSAQSKQINQREHNADASAKRVSLRSFNASTGNWDNTSLSMGKIVYEQYDYISLTPDSSRPTSVVYKLGGSGGTTVATLTIAYDGSTNNITSVTKS